MAQKDCEMEKYLVEAADIEKLLIPLSDEEKAACAADLAEIES